jgi:hypothetical protein
VIIEKDKDNCEIKITLQQWNKAHNADNWLRAKCYAAARFICSLLTSIQNTADRQLP